MEKRREHLQKQIDACIDKAKECLSKNNKPAAQLALKRKAMYIKQLETVENNILRLTEMRMGLELGTGTAQTVNALQAGAQAHKATMAEYKVEKVDKIMDEIQYAADQAAEVQAALAMPLGPAAAIDEDELEAELADMQQQQLDAELLSPAPVPTGPIAQRKEESMPEVPLSSPAVPSGRPATKTTEDELAELEAELSAP